MAGLTEARIRQLNGKVPELMGATEVAAELGVAQSNLPKISGLPPHATTLGRGRIWRADVIRTFAEERRKRQSS